MAREDSVHSPTALADRTCFIAEVSALWPSINVHMPWQTVPDAFVTTRSYHDHRDYSHALSST